jgi:threonine dehydratase
VVAYSSGNHAQGVAAAAQIFDLPATIVMPSDAPDIKIQNTRSYGADIEFYDRKIGNRVKIAKRISDETGGLLILGYNDPDIIAGQGTIALELIRQSEELNVKLDIVMGPSSGGSMMSGCSLALKHYDPRVMLYCVEPENYNAIGLSLACGQRIKLKPKEHSICDGLLLEMLDEGAITFQILKEQNVGALVVSDQATLHAMLVAFQVFKIVLEPSGAVALAAALEQKINLKGKTVAVICTGGNVDPNLFHKALEPVSQGLEND